MTNEVCSVCGAEFSKDDAECPTCGLKLADKTQSFKPVALESEQKANALSQPGDITLVVTKGAYEGQVFPLDREKMTVGRDPGCDIFLNDMTVSREHAVITTVDGRAVIEDQGSLNGTWINGDIAQSADLALGTTLQIGTFNMTVEQA